MSFNIYTLKKFLLPSALFSATVLVALFVRSSRDWLLPVMFLLLPFADFFWRTPNIRWEKRSQIGWTILVVAMAVFLIQNLEVLDVFTVMVLVAALPEEWFFRAYLQKRLGNSVAAVLVVSLMFSLMHFITHSFTSTWLVFIPSVFFGWIYKQTSDLVLVVLLHALSNLVYYIYLESYIMDFFG